MLNRYSVIWTQPSGPLCLWQCFPYLFPWMICCVHGTVLTIVATCFTARFSRKVCFLCFSICFQERYVVCCFYLLLNLWLKVHCYSIISVNLFSRKICMFFAVLISLLIRQLKSWFKVHCCLIIFVNMFSRKILLFLLEPFHRRGRVWLRRPVIFISFTANSNYDLKYINVLLVSSICFQERHVVCCFYLSPCQF